MVDHHVLNLKMLRKSLFVNLPREFTNLCEGSSLVNPRKPPLWDRDLTFWSRGVGASEAEGWEIESKGVKVTLFGTSDSNGMPLKLSFPWLKSKHFSRLFDLKPLRTELIGSFGGAMEERGKRNRVKKQRKNRNQRCRDI